MGAIELMEKGQLIERPRMKAGDTVRVHVRVKEGDKERIQIFEGVIINLRRGGVRGVVHGPQGVVRAGRRAHLPAALADHSEGGRRPLGQGAPRQAVLPARAEGQGGAHEGSEEKPAAARRAHARTGREHCGSVKKVGARRTIENALRRYGFVWSPGVDEVGRGCLAGPVMAGAVVLDPERHISGPGRLEGADRGWAAIGCTTRSSRAPSRGRSSRSSRRRSTRSTFTRPRCKAMQRAVHALAPLPDVVLVDAFRIPALLMAQRGVIGGDRQCAAIAAASIVAKVTRDRLMDRLHADDPRYGFDRHKGYATADHLAAVARHGYSSVHRRSFRPPTLFDTMAES